MAARAVVNATGPWVSRLRDARDAGARRAPGAAGQGQPHHRAAPVRAPLRLHLPERGPAHRLRDPLRARLHAARHHRRRLSRRPGAVHIEPRRLATCAHSSNRYFRQPITPADVVWSYSGVRPLLEDESSDPMSVTRDYALEAGPRAGAAAVGVRRQDHDLPQALRGCRRTCSRPVLGGVARRPGPHAAVLPGGDMPEGSFAVFLRTLERRYPGCPAACAAAMRTPTARASRACWRAPAASRNWVTEVLPSSTSASSSTWCARNLRVTARTFSGAAPSSDCTC